MLDVSSSTVLDQAATVEKVLGDLGAADKPRVVALNKVDLLGPSARRRAIGDVTRRYPGAVAISATKRTGLKELLGAVEKSSRGDTVDFEILVPYGGESVLAALRKVGGVERTEYVDGGTRAWGWVPRHAAQRFEAYAATPGRAAKSVLQDMGLWQTWVPRQPALAQSLPAAHFAPPKHLGHVGPPQSTSLSEPLRTPSVHVGAAHL